MRDFVRGVVRLRHQAPALRRGSFATAGADWQSAAYLRADGEDAFVVCINAGEEPTWLELALPGRDGAAARRRSRRRAGRGRCRTSARRFATDERGSACRRGARRSCA